MSLSKQLLILITMLFMMIFSLNFLLSVNNIKSYLEGESQNHAQDTATSLGLSLSPYLSNPNDPLIKTMASAIFDMGYYSEIRLVDAQGREVLALRNDKSVEGVPDWFIAYLPMTPATAQSEISTGWTISGVVYVTVNTTFAYSKLYQQAQSAFYSSLMAFVGAMGLLVLMLRITLASLKRLDQLASAIADGNFQLISPLPWTSEVNSLAASMNVMSGKLKTTIDSLHDKLAAMGSSLLRDDLTGLYKKSVLETDLMNLAVDEHLAYLLLIKLDSLNELIKDRDRDSIDKLLQAVAKALQSPPPFAEVQTKAYRFYGGEFALLVQQAQFTQLEAIAHAVSHALAELGEIVAQPDLAHIGIVPINPLSPLDHVLEAALEAYEQARLIGANSYYLRTDQNIGRDISAWKALVFQCIDQASYQLAYCGQIFDFKSNHLLIEEAFTQAHDQDGQLVPIGPFVSIAEKFAKIVDLDKGVIVKVLQHINQQQIKHLIAVNVSTRSIKNPEFHSWLQKLLKAEPVAARQLVFGLSAYAVAKDIKAYLDFTQTVHQLNGRVMIKRFETQSMPPQITKQLKPDFIRLSREIGNGVSQSQQKHDFVQAMQQLAVLLGMQVLAENVEHDDDLKTLKAIGIMGASR